MLNANLTFKSVTPVSLEQNVVSIQQIPALVRGKTGLADVICTGTCHDTK